MLGIVVTIVLVYLAIGAMLWALVLHPLDQARAIPLTILTWPRHIVPLIMIVIAAGFAFAVRIVSRPAGLFRVRADDPYFFPIGEHPTVPREDVR